jgi:diguanylate cyclase (GGDEF)-like protein/PAS domain S-box-containing protein
MHKINLLRLIFPLLCGLFLLIPPAFAADKVLLKSSHSNGTPLSLTEYFSILEDPTLALTLADVQTPDISSRFITGTSPAEALSFGYTHSAYWLRFTLRNETDSPLERMLEIGHARISSVQFHQPLAAGRYQPVLTGNMMPFDARPYKNRFYVFPVTLPPHADQVFYLRFQSVHSLAVPARLWEPQAFHAYERNDYLGQALYFGIVTAMVLFNLLLFIALRDVIYLMYVSFVTVMSLSLAAQNGLGKEFIWPGTLLWSDIATPVGYALSFAALLTFMRQMLNTKKVIPQLDQMLKYLVGMYLLIPVLFAFYLHTFIKPSALLYLLTAFLIIGVGLLCASKHQRSAYFFLAAFAVLVIAIVVTVLTNFGLLPSNILTMNALQFGSAAEMLLLSLALADRFNEIRREKESAQRETLRAQNYLIEGLKLSEKMLEVRVAERTAELRIAATAFDSHECSVVTDANGIILKINPAFQEDTGYTAEEVIGHTMKFLQSGRHDCAFYASLWASLHRAGMWQGEIWNRRKNGEIYPKWLTITAVKRDDGVVTHYVGTHQDITDRKVAEERIAELAFFDPLTNLPNRTLLKDRIKQAMTTGKRQNTFGALLLLDLDQFKTLNDTLGHEKGDQLLRQVGTRLLISVREGDTIARLGGDEFVVLLPNINENAEVAAKQTEFVGNKILAVLTDPYQLDDTEYLGTSSIGATIFRGDETSIDDVLKQADLAMYKSKSSGRNALYFFDQAMQTVVMERVSLEAALRNALHEKQFLLHYQAQVIDGGHVTGAEVLVRWQHPQRGMVSPAEFIPLAEETGLILPLGLWVLETACAQLYLWSTQADMVHLTLAVNVSAHQFRLPNFVDQVLRILQKSGANPHRLKLELTESLLVDNVQDIIEKMTLLKAHGVRFSLDDFGTGYSSLSYLKRLPLYQLKIDQSFVRDILVDANDAAIATTIIALAKSLGLEVIAEGVETESQRDFLSSSGCQAYQGYFFSRPLPLDGFNAFARKP